MEKKRNSNLAKLNRILIWLTFVLFVFYVICGFGIINSSSVSSLTGGILNRDRSAYFHTTLTAPVLILLLVHMMIGLRFNLIHWGVREGKLLNAFVIGLGVFFIALFIILQYVRL
ncbi:hypothetical protein MUP79_03585 [Candidatus Bathyarchaeota archaeon]|jgi:succinate dehydrogenase hydrophobic anchor subunit|nr:hypothetical protein [Candidatus Bathyarchaeota archaeon]